jgi:trehalose-phosphatase
MVGLDQLTYAGNHGLELLEPGAREAKLDPALGHRGAAAAAFAGRLDWDRLETVGLRLEDKGPIQAIHWRGAADPATARQRADELAELAAEQGLVPHFGRLVLELRPVAEVHKGVASRRLVEEARARLALFAGDDETDRDAFAALRDLAGAGSLERAVCVAVASEEGPPGIQREADLVVPGTEGFLDLLRRL